MTMDWSVAIPAMLNSSMDNSFIFQHNFYFAGIDNGYAGFAKYMPGMKSMIHGGVHYLSYGQVYCCR